MMRKYEKLAAFDLGYALHETGVFTPAGSAKYPRKPHVSLVPLDGMVAYYHDLDIVVARLEVAAVELVSRFNNRAIKRPLEWRDEICRQDWIGKNGRPETTIFELRLTTYGFFLSGVVHPINTADLKVPLTFSQGLLMGLISLFASTGSNQDEHHC